ncbi:MAG: DUF4199 domain-containing protein [Flavihumibacter sp.]
MRLKLSLLTGLGAGALYAAGLIISHQSGTAALAAFRSAYTFLPLVIVIIGLGAVWLRRNEKPAPEVKDLLKYAFLAYTVFELCYALSSLTVFRWMDPAASENLANFLYRQTEEKLKNGQGSAEKLEEIKKIADSVKGPMTYIQVLIGMGQDLIIDFLKSLFIATITKRTIQPRP